MSKYNITREFLILEYVIKKRIMKDIAKELGCSVGPIRKYLKLYNIIIRKGPWNKNLTKETDNRVAKYGKSISIVKKGKTCGEKNGFFGKHHTRKTRDILRRKKLDKSNNHKETCICPFCRDHNGENNPFFKHKHTDDTRNKMRENRIDVSGPNNPRFGAIQSNETRSKISLAGGGTGIPYENTEYGADFDTSLKEQVRFRDKYKCRICGCSQLENCRQLDVHHMDYDKKHSILKNLVALCASCHRKTNYNRKHWLSYFCKLVLSK